jgi:hypothetical protein
MSAPEYRESLAVLAEICELSPDVRLGQLFAHLGFLGESHLDRQLADLDDDEMLSILYRHRDELLARHQQINNDSVSQRIA